MHLEEALISLDWTRFWKATRQTTGLSIMIYWYRTRHEQRATRDGEHIVTQSYIESAPLVELHVTPVH